ncbi:MAG: hypothetical protein AB7F43_06990 [Bacteriovoracia bacterium]
MTIFRICMTSLLLLVGARAFAGFDYFGSQIDYWNKNPKKDPITEVVKPAPPSTPTVTKDEKFDWNKYLDPKNKDFFKEGDYTPPEPFMEVVRNPSDSNLKNWFTYIDKKNDLVRKMQERVEEYARKNAKLPPEVKALLAQRSAELPTYSPDVKRYRFRLYFDSKCPACKQMLGTLAAIQERGYSVEAHQIDNDRRATERLPFPVLPASKSDLDEKEIKAVPVLYVGDMTQKRLYRFRGTQELGDIFEALKNGTGAQKLK